MKFVFLTILLVLSFTNSQLFDFIQKSEHKLENKKTEASLFETLGKVHHKKKQGPFGINAPAPKIIQKQVTKKEYELKEHKESPVKNLGPSHIASPPKIVPAIPEKKAPVPKKSETEKIDKEIEKQKKEISDVEKKVETKINSQKKELSELENKFDEINKKTKNVEDILSQHASFENLKEKLSNDSQLWDQYIQKLTTMNIDMEALNEELTKMEGHLNNHRSKHHVENSIAQTPKIKAEVDHSLRVEGNLTTDRLVAEELRFPNSRISGNFVEVENDFLISIGGKGYPIKNAIQVNNLINKLRENCGENLSCIVSLEEEKERLEKEELIEKTLKNIKEHLDSLKN